jgi:guanine deaminase
MTYDDQLMARAIALAGEGVRRGAGGPFGAVVARAGDVVGEGFNEVLSSGDPTAHAEVQALRAAARALGTHDLAGCELYASCEPCPMCHGAALWSRVDAIWFTATRQDADAAGFDDGRFHAGAELPPFTHVDHDRRREPFEVWAALEDRRLY